MDNHLKMWIRDRCYIYFFVPTAKIVSKSAPFYRFKSIVLSLQTSKWIVFSFYRFIVLSFFGKKHRLYSIVLSFYRCKENIEFFYRFIVSSFYRCRPIVLLVPRPPRSAGAGDYWIRVCLSVCLSTISIPR